MEFAKCICGGNATLTFETKIGRYEDKFIKINNVPTYRCLNCDEAFIDGVVAKKFGELIQKAFFAEINEIDFKDDIFNPMQVMRGIAQKAMKEKGITYEDIKRLIEKETHRR